MFLIGLPAFISAWQYSNRQSLPSRSFRAGSFVLPIALGLLAVAIGIDANAQTGTPGLSTLNTPHPDTSVGPPHTGTVEQNAHEQLSLGSGQLSLYIPILSLPQRGGRTINLGYVHSSNTWAAKETDVTYNQYGTANAANPQTWWEETSATVQYVPIIQAPYSSSLHPNYPTLAADLTYAGAYSQPTGVPTFYASYCVSGWTFTDWQGSSHSFRGYRDCTSQYGPQFASPAWMKWAEAVDDSGYQLDTRDTSDLKVIAPDGDVYHFTGYTPPPNNGGQLVHVSASMQLNYYAKPFSSMVDPNGNTVTLSNWLLTDTTGRQVSLGSWMDQSSPTATPSMVAVTRQDTSSETIVPLPTSGLPACYAKAYPPGQGPSAAGYHGPQITFQPPPSVSASSTTNLTLPDGTFYALTYDASNRLVKIRYPAGGYTRYDYDLNPWYSSQAQDEGDMMCSHPRMMVVAKHECTLASGGCTQSPVATANSCDAGKQNGGEATTCYGLSSAHGFGGLTVTDPLQNRTEYAFSAEYTEHPNGTIAEIPRTIPAVEQRHQVFSPGSSAPTRTVDTTYSALIGCPSQGENCNDVSSAISTTYNDANPASVAATSWRSQYPGLTTQTQRGDFSGNIISAATTVYKSGGIYSTTPGTPGTLYHILDHIQSVSSTETATNHNIATSNTYDGLGNLVQADTSGTGAISRSTSFVRDSQGNIIQTKDPMQFTGQHSGSTTLSYANQSIPGCPAYDETGIPTLTTNAAGHMEEVAYSPLGRVLCTQDANTKIRKFSYDSLGRVTEIIEPDNGQITITHSTQTPLQVTSVQSAGRTTVSTLDGFGREIQAMITSAPEGAICTETFYDANGNVAAKSNPHSTCPSAFDAPISGASTNYSYNDALGRMTGQTNEDGSSKSWVYSGAVTTSVDEAGHSTQRISDPFGRLVELREPNASGTPNISTYYSYDGFDNLVNVQQAGASGETPRTRSFSYDGFSHLLVSTNPETGTICYGAWSGGSVGSGNCQNGYDANGNLLSKTDANNSVISYTYDALNRLILKSYPSGYPVSFGYDGYSGNGVWMPGLNNVVGRITHISNSVNAATQYSYDPMGRTGFTKTCLPSSCDAPVTTSATYDLAGNMISLTYPDGRQVTQSWDSAGRLSKVGDGTNTQAYVESVTYNPDSTPNVTTYGNGVQQTVSKNHRLQVESMTISSPVGPLSGSMFSSHTYCYSNCGTPSANNGNILGITDGLNPARSQSFTYDGLNRISSFSLGGTLNQQYGIDSFGNLTLMLGNNPVTTFDTNTNRINNLPCAGSVPSYDAAGNQLCDSDPYGGVREYRFDAENRISQIAGLNSETSPFVSYTYGADGTRVRKSNANGSFTEYVNFAGQPIAEKDQNLAWTDYVYANGSKIAKVETSDRRIHMSGTNTADAQARGTYIPWTVANYVVQNGDKISWRQYQAGSCVGGLYVVFSDGSSPNWTTLDEQGQPINSDTTTNTWLNRTVDLSAFAGKVMQVANPINDVNAPNGTFDIYWADIAIVSTSGTVTTIYNGSDIGSLPAIPFFDTAEVSNAAARTEVANNLPGDSARVHFYVSDHLGSAQMEFSSGGWPVSASQFLPFGGEINPQPTINHYKFTGKERDAESGLDYFGARYYGSNMGRWMSPDPSGLAFADPGNPQSLNLYGYVGNNPLRFTDPTGLLSCGSDGASATASTTGLVNAVQNFFHAVGCGIQSALSSSDSGTNSGPQQGSGPRQSGTAPYFRDIPDNLRLFPTGVTAGNHNIDYKLRTADGKHQPYNTWYVYEHQTQSVAGGHQVGPGDYVTPYPGNDYRNEFVDEIGGWLDTNQSFSISPDRRYNVNSQYNVMLRYGGADKPFQHLKSTGGQVSIDGSTRIPSAPDDVPKQ